MGSGLLSARFIRLIEDHREQIGAAAISAIRQGPELSHMGRLPESELRDWASGILMCLQCYPVPAEREELSSRFQKVGRQRFEEAIPLHEAIRSLQVLKGKIINFVRNEGLARNSLDVYAEQELEHEVGLLFDRLLYSVALGYEEALRAAAQQVPRQKSQARGVH
jgi:hypothetical protein